MFRGFSTRKERKKIPNLKITDETQLIDSLEKIEGQNNLYKMIINPEIYNKFYTNHYNYDNGSGNGYIYFNLTGADPSNTKIQQILNNLPDETASIQVIFKRLTMFTQSTYVNTKITKKSDTKYVKIITPDGEKTYTMSFENDFESTIEVFQLVYTESTSDDYFNIKIEPVEWKEDANGINFKGMTKRLITTVGNFKKLKLTNFRIAELDSISRKYETNLVVKGDISSIIDMKLPITFTDPDTVTTLKSQITSINDIVDTGIPVSEGSEETKKIGIDNVLAEGAIMSLNDSSIDFRGVELTDEQKTEAYWTNFYVNKITRYSNQVFESGFKGYRGTELVSATEVVVTIAPAIEVSINDQELTIKFGNEEPGFLGENEEINLGTEANPNKIEAVAIYLNEEMSAQVRDNMNDVSTVKLVVSNMRIITQQTEPNVDCFVKRVVDGTTVEPTYVAVYFLNASNVYSKHTEPIENLTQQIISLNVIYGEVVEKGEDEDKKKLFIPATITSVWNNNKLNLETITPEGDVSLSEIQTTNCLIVKAKLNLVVQGEIPIDWYNWLPLNNVYVGDDKKVLVNPTGSGNYSSLTKIVSVNALPSDDIGIDISNPSELDLSEIDLETGESLENN